jgi:uroporphyrinogen-III synthase
VSAPDQPRRIWITRTLPEAAATAERVAAMGLIPVIAPVLAVQAVSPEPLDLTGIDALAFTSRHAIDQFAQRCPVRDLAVFTVGDATAARAREHGFGDVRSADGDVRALAELVAAARPRRVLNPTAREPAADLCALLAARGVAAEAVVVYETVPAPIRAALSQFDAVLVHSARAARVLAAAIAGDPERAQLHACAISEAAAAPLRDLGLRAVSVAPRPSEAALLALLRG